jgi:hypothetical protein
VVAKVCLAAWCRQLLVKATEIGYFFQIGIHFLVSCTILKPRYYTFFIIRHSVFDIRRLWQVTRCAREIASQVTRFARDPVAGDPCKSLKIPAVAKRRGSFAKKQDFKRA